MTRKLAVFFALATGVQAGNVLVFEDLLHGTSAIPGALALWGGCGICTTRTTSAAFNADLTAGGWDLVIYAEQNASTFVNSATQLATWVAGGGKLIGQTWRTGGLDALLQASAASTNGSTITTSGHAIFAGLGGTIALANPGWITFSRGWNPTGLATGLGTLDSGGSAVIHGNSGRTFLNAPLTDTYNPGSDGERLLANEIGFLMNPVPEPSTLVFMGIGTAALGFARARRK